MNDLELGYLCLLHSIKGIGSKSLVKIKNLFGSFEQCFTANSDKLYASFLPVNLAEQIIHIRRNADPLGMLQQIHDKDINITWIDDNDYPVLLRSIPDPPYIIYYKGHPGTANSICIAVVGCRAATIYGRNTARDFARELAYIGVVVVSGMARGIDTEAHRGALEGGGKTIAVLGSGLDIIYPRENQQLFQDICNSGMVISEFSPGTIPEPGNFPMRNRIISGLSRGVLVVEAKARSGSLITADFALEQGRDVFAVPGPITSKNSQGTNDLIKQGAVMVTCSEDIINEYNDMIVKPKDLPPEDGNIQLDNDEKNIIQYMGYNPIHFDELVNKTGYNIGLMSSILLGLEFKGIIKGIPGNYYVRI